MRSSARASSATSTSTPRRAAGRHRRRDARARFRARDAPDAPALDRDDVPRAASWAWSSRLQALRAMSAIEDGDGEGVVVDCCCGHALLALGCASEANATRVVAIDRSEAEIERAKKNVARAKKEVEMVGGDGAAVDSVDLRLGDGLSALRDDERVDVLVVAGVGANTMARVLEEGGCEGSGNRRGSLKRVVLNPPAKDGAQVRRWLHANDYRVVDERLVVENGTMHLILCAENETAATKRPFTMRDEIIGPCLGAQSPKESPLLKLYVKKRLEWVREVRRQSSLNLTRLERLADAGDAVAVSRLREDVAHYDEMEAILLEFFGVNVEEQRRNVEAELERQIVSSFEGFDDNPTELVYKVVDPEESDGRLGICRQFLDEDAANELLSSLVSSPPVTWAQRSIVVWQPDKGVTKEVVQPRLVSWAGDLPYKYSGQTLDPVPVPEVLRRLQTAVEAKCGATFNHILLNRYRDGDDSMAFHADDEPELGKNACIAAVSVGHTRKFDVQVKSRAKKKTSIFLEHGSLMVMDGSLQHTHYHAVPKNRVPTNGKERINITFRYLRGPPGWRQDDDDATTSQV